MKKAVIMAAAAVLLCLSSALSCAAQDIPVLTSISFDNAEIDGSFSPDIYDYTLVLSDAGSTPSLKSYDVEGKGDLLVKYIYDESGVQTGILATLSYENGSAIYTFTYSYTQQAEESSDNYLTDIFCNLAELSPKISEEETKYTLYIPSDLTELSLTPITRDTNASCPPVELTLTEEQAPQITLVCTASDGSEREYTLVIKRADKTVAQALQEKAETGSVSLATDEKQSYKQELFVLLLCAAAGLILLAVMYRFAVRAAAKTVDVNEEPFYKE